MFVSVDLQVLVCRSLFVGTCLDVSLLVSDGLFGRYLFGNQFKKGISLSLLLHWHSLVGVLYFGHDPQWAQGDPQ